jgi:copper transport protein
VALALSGHASAAEPQWLTRPAVFIHGVAAAFWTGALLPLAVIVGTRRGASLPIVRRFSRLATPMVVLMAVAGVILGVVQVETPSALLTTRYGQVLLAKMAAVSGLLALAWLNRRRLAPALATPTGGRNLVRSIACEIALVVAILGLVATWRLTPPPRALAAAAAEPLSVHFHAAPAMVELTFSSRRTGPVTASLVLMTGDFGPLDPKEVTLSLANPGAGIEPIERRAERAPDGTWGVKNLVVPLPGRWRVHVDVLINDFEKTSIDGDIEVLR